MPPLLLLLLYLLLLLRKTKRIAPLPSNRFLPETTRFEAYSPLRKVIHTTGGTLPVSRSKVSGRRGSLLLRIVFLRLRMRSVIGDQTIKGRNVVIVDEEFAEWVRGRRNSSRCRCRSRRRKRRESFLHIKGHRLSICHLHHRYRSGRRYLAVGEKDRWESGVVCCVRVIF